MVASRLMQMSRDRPGLSAVGSYNSGSVCHDDESGAVADSELEHRAADVTVGLG
jgi:hypothetical protein